ADPGRVAVPFLQPVTVNLPVGTRRRIPVVGAPQTNRLVCLVELTVRPVMGRGGDPTSRGGRADNLAVPGERGVQFNAHFQVDHIVPVERDVPAGSRDLLRADDAPYQAAGIRNDFREFVAGRATADNRKRTAGELFESDGVFHAIDLRLEARFRPIAT